jgi:hypothetical protein
MAMRVAAATREGAGLLEDSLAAVAEVDPGIAARTSRALAVVLSGTLTSPWQSVAWSSSSLTQSGYPLEFAVSSGRRELRYAADVVGPERSASDAFGVGCSVLGAVGSPVPEGTVVERVRVELLRAHDLLYGARIGGRHGARGDHFKLYVEVPHKTSDESMRGMLRSFTDDGPVARLELGRLRMLGINASASLVEAYFRTEVADAREAIDLVRRTALAERASDLVDFVEATAKLGGRSAFRQATLGVSVAFDADGKTTACAFFRPARFLFSSDAAARCGLLELCAERGLALPFYSELTRPLQVEQHTRHRWHGLLAWSVAGEGAPLLSVGLAPPSDTGRPI